MTQRRLITIAIFLLSLPAGRLAAQSGNLNAHVGPRFDEGGRYTGVGAELQIGPRPWMVKATASFLAGFPPKAGPDIEGALGLIWIRERSDARLFPFIGAGAAVIQRHFVWANIANPAGFVHAGVLIRRGTNGNFGIDARFLKGGTRDRLDGTFESVRYFQVTALLGWGW